MNSPRRTGDLAEMEAGSGGDRYGQRVPERVESAGEDPVGA
jgi:hypothetical protein